MRKTCTMEVDIPKFIQTQEIEVILLVLIMFIKVSGIIFLLNNVAEFITDPDPYGTTYTNSAHGKYEM